MDQVKIGQFIQNLRKEKNMTQQELAEKLGVTDRSVSNWENGKNMPDVSLYKLLCAELNITVNELISGEKIEEKKYKEKSDENIIIAINSENRKLNKIKIKSKIIISILSLMILLLIIITCILLNKNTDEYRFDGPKPNEKLTKRNYLNSGKIYSIEKEDGWVCRFLIDYGNNNKSYSYTCFNIKYSDITGFNYYEYDTIKNSYFVSNDVPGYYNNIEYQEDVLKISNYFNNKQFDKEITEKDLKDLDLNKIKKQDVIDLYNKTINQELITKYGNLIGNHGFNKWVYEYKSYDTNNTYIIGYYIDDYGYIRNIYLDLKIGADRASNLINKKILLDDQIILYDKLQEVKEYILTNQKFDIPNKYNKDKDIKGLKEAISFLNKNNGINTSLYSDTRYINNEDEMNNQIKGPEH